MSDATVHWTTSDVGVSTAIPMAVDALFGQLVSVGFDDHAARRNA